MADVNREAVAWGVVGGLSFLVLVLAYELVAGARVSVLVTLGVGVVVAAVVALASAAFDSRRRENESA